ncbi:MAG TPA: M55 family metallopeptidase, partial [Streptosporangiaceae bacterium]
MKVYISVDMEGVSGLTDADDMHPGGRGYDRGCELMTADANA